MDYNKFTKALAKAVKKNPEIFTSVELKGHSRDGVEVHDIVIDSYAKRGMKFFKDHTTDEVNKVVAMAVQFRGSIKCRVCEGVFIRMDVKEGKNSQSFSWEVEKRKVA